MQKFHLCCVSVFTLLGLNCGAALYRNVFTNRNYILETLNNNFGGQNKHICFQGGLTLRADISQQKPWSQIV